MNMKNKGNINTGILIVILVIIVAALVYWFTNNTPEEVPENDGSSIELNLTGSDS